MLADPNAIEFAQGCYKRGLCPRCLNAGSRNDDKVENGVCQTCGYQVKHEIEIALTNKQMSLL